MAVDKRSTRLGMLAMVSLLLLGAIGTRLWFLQGVQAADYQSKVDAAKTRTVYVAPERGRIFDTKGRVLADNRRILTVTVDWAVIRKRSARTALFQRLAGPLGVPYEELMKRFDPCFGEPTVPKCTKGQIYSQLLPLPLKEDVSENTVTFLKERSEDYPGVDVTEEWQRIYPYAPLASHVVGYMGGITKETLSKYLGEGYNRNEKVGQFGVELQLENVLHGNWGKRVFEIDATGSIVRELDDERVLPVAGQDVQLTIDLDVQQYAEQTLETELKNQRELPLSYCTDDPEERTTCGLAHNGIDPKDPTRRVYFSSKEYATQEWVPFKAPAGSVVIEDHTNGHILAMASYPTFDNRWMVSNISGEKFNQLFPATDDPDKSILVNRAVQGRYNIGSTIKPFIAWSAMDAGLLQPNEEFLDEGTYTLYGIPKPDCQQNGGLAKCIFKNASNASGVPSKYGTVTVEDALAVSSDAFFYHLGELFYWSEDTRTALKQHLEQFGFGNRTGIELPFEWGGRVPDSAVKADLVAKGVLAKNEVPRLTVGDNVQVSIGQGLFAATPLQLANAYSTLANDGYLLTPHIVKAILAPLTPDKEPEVADLSVATVISSNDGPDVKGQLAMPQETYGPILTGLERVIRGPGTYYPKTFYHSTTGEYLFQGFLEDTPLYGKTGTAQGAGNYPWNDSSVFTAFSESPTMPYTITAYLEKSGYGARAAAPVVKCIFGMLAGRNNPDPVQISDQLDLNSSVPAPANPLTDATCLGGAESGIKD